MEYKCYSAKFMYAFYMHQSSIRFPSENLSPSNRHLLLLHEVGMNLDLVYCLYLHKLILVVMCMVIFFLFQRVTQHWYQSQVYEQVMYDLEHMGCTSMTQQLHSLDLVPIVHFPCIVTLQIINITQCLLQSSWKTSSASISR